IDDDSKKQIEKAGATIDTYNESQTGRVGFTITKKFTKIEDFNSTYISLTNSMGDSSSSNNNPGIMPAVKLEKGSGSQLILSGSWDTKGLQDFKKSLDEGKTKGPDELDMSSIYSTVGATPVTDPAKNKAAAKAVYDAMYKDPPAASFSITLPGNIKSHNASKKDNNTLTWDMFKDGGTIEAVFELSGGNSGALPTVAPTVPAKVEIPSQMMSYMTIPEKDLSNYLTSGRYSIDSKSTRGADAHPAFLRSIGNPASPSKLQDDAAKSFQATIFAAEYADSNNIPAFPSVRSAAPVAAKLANRAAQDANINSALQRFTNMLASMDMKAQQ
ncbi:MAG: hypothetical protein Q7O66_06635, partial [Dehalococcoidia bacterium]|nr:hypothetical protein [Dehalococcoidia bacterium]